MREKSEPIRNNTGTTTFNPNQLTGFYAIITFTLNVLRVIHLKCVKG